MNAAALSKPPRRWPTGFPHLDDALLGGLPRGRLTQLLSADVPLLQRMARHLVVQQQGAAGVVACVDGGTSLSAKELKRHGVTTAELLLSHPKTYSEAIAVTDSLARSGAVELVIVIGTESLPPGEGDFVEALKRLSGVATPHDAVVVFFSKTLAPTPGTLPLRALSTLRVELTTAELPTAFVRKSLQTPTFARAPLCKTRTLPVAVTRFESPRPSRLPR